MLVGFVGIADKADALQSATLDKAILGKKFDPKQYREMNRNVVEDVASLTA